MDREDMVHTRGGALVLPLWKMLWTAARQAPLSMGLSRQQSWSGLPFPSPGDIPDPWVGPVSPAQQADSLPLSRQGSLGGILLNHKEGWKHAICSRLMDLEIAIQVK